jgi:TM2 domain protein
MDSQKVDLFLATSQKFFEPAQLPFIREQLSLIDDSRFLAVSSMEYRDPMMMLLVSIIGGSLGIDRFILGDTGLGVAKLLTAGGCGIFIIIDWFQIQSLTRRKNMELFMRALNF